LIIFLHTTETFHFFSPIWIRLEGSYIFKVFKDLLMIFVIQNFASFFFKVNETDWSRDFKFFLFARFSHNQPLLFLLIPHSPTITFKTMFHCPQHLVKFLRNSISTHTHTQNCRGFQDESKNVEMSKSWVSKTLWNNTPEEIAHPVHCLSLHESQNVRVHVRWDWHLKLTALSRGRHTTYYITTKQWVNMHFFSKWQLTILKV